MIKQIKTLITSNKIKIMIQILTIPDNISRNYYKFIQKCEVNTQENQQPKRSCIKKQPIENNWILPLLLENQKHTKLFLKLQTCKKKFN